MQSRIDTLLLALAIRSHADARHILLDDAEAMQRALATNGSGEERLLHWVASSEASPRFMPAIRSVLRGGCAILGGVLVLAFLSGLVAGASALETRINGAVNIPMALMGLIGVQFLFLLMWLGIVGWTMVRGRGAGGLGGASGVPGRVALFLLERVTSLPGVWRASDTYPSAVAAVSGLFGRGRPGRWVLGAVTHMVWLLFSIGALVSCWMLLVAVQYDFTWGTTLLSDGSARSLLLAIAWFPDVVGLPTPDAALLGTTRGNGVPEHAERQIWAQFLLSCLLIYGVLPRFVLALVCALLARAAVAKAALDQGHPVFQEALIRLRRSGTDRPPLGDEPAAVLRHVDSGAHGATFGRGAFFALAALELDDDDRWPPRGQGWNVVSLAHVQTRAEGRDLLADIDTLDPEPRFVAVVASLARSPDRGAMDFLREVAGAARAPVLLILAESHIVSERGENVARRVDDWRDRAERIGIAAVMVADWDELGAASQSTLENSLRNAGVT